MNMDRTKEETSDAASDSPDHDWDHWIEWNADSPFHPAANESIISSAHPPDSQYSSVIRDESPNSAPVSKEGITSPRPAKKRKVSTESAESGESPRSQRRNSTAVQYKSHNHSHSIIEKRYRTNLNDKIADLRKTVPSLRGDPSNSIETERLPTASKHNKSTILTKAIEYIHHLEQRNAYLENVNVKLRSEAGNVKSKSVQAGDDIRVESSEPSYPATEDSPSANEDSPSVSDPPQGIIPVPDDVRKLRIQGDQEHYADRIIRHDQQSGAHFSIRGGHFVGKLVIGSLAGLMIMDSFVGDRRDREHDRGLFALPFSASLPISRPLWALQERLASLPYACILLPLIKGFLVFSILGFALFLYLFNSKPKSGLKPAAEGKNGSRSSASPIEVREMAWLTAIQTLKVPRHSWFPEMMALILETGAYMIRQLLGWESYSWLMGRSEEEEVARVRAWEIAIDAQLTGGDAEVSRSRLVLTVWAAGTLPKTPARLMLKALHIRIMFWQASRWPRISWAFNRAASRLAQYQWTLAKRMLDTPPKVDVTVGSESVEPLSDHLLALLQRPPEDVMTDLTIQQAHSLCWNRSASTTLGDVGVDDSAEDTAMRGPLDALALWSSSLVLQEALSNFLESGQTNQVRFPQIEIALSTAPPGSSSFIRALAAKTIFSEADRAQNIIKLLEALSAVSFPGSDVSPLSSVVCNDVSTSIEFAKALNTVAGPQSDTVSLDGALQLLDRTCSEVKRLELLALAAAYRLVLVLVNDSAITGEKRCSLNQIILNMVSQLDSPDSTTVTSNQEKFKTALQTLKIQRRSSNASFESGYASM